MSKLFKDITENDVIHVSNLEQWKYISELIHKTNWQQDLFYGDKTCINLLGRSYGDVSFYKGVGKNIISYNDFINFNKLGKNNYYEIY